MCVCVFVCVSVCVGVCEYVWGVCVCVCVCLQLQWCLYGGPGASVQLLVFRQVPFVVTYRVLVAV